MTMTEDLLCKNCIGIHPPRPELEIIYCSLKHIGNKNSSISNGIYHGFSGEYDNTLVQSRIEEEQNVLLVRESKFCSIARLY